MDAGNYGKRRYRNVLSDNQDQIAFFVTFLTGAIAIWLLKTLGYSQVTSTIVPLALMILYAGIAWISKRYRLREDRIGDNVYYLGFLYTLTSLAHALYAYDVSGSGAQQIINNFGIAIFTTIVGLAGRVLFNQMRQDPEEYEREARYSLAETSNTLRSQLGEVALDMSSFRRKLTQIMEEGIEEIAQAANTALTKNAANFSETSNSVIEEIRTAFARFTDHAEQLTTLAGKNADALEALFERIQSIEASPNLLSQKLSPIIGQFAEVADEAMRRNRNQTNDLKRFKDLIETTCEASENLQTVIKSTDELLTGKLEAFTSGLEGNLAVTEKLTGKLGEVADRMAVALTSVGSITEESQASLDAQKGGLHSLRTSIETDLAQIQKHRADAYKLASESQSALAQVQDGLVSLVHTITEQLREKRET